MRAYYHTTQPNQLRELLAQTDAHFHAGGRWVESNMAPLAQTCVYTHLYEDGVKYYKELIPLHQRTAPNRGIGDGTLSSYYQQLAEAYSGLGKTMDAIDAACGGIVSWGFGTSQRADALGALKNVIQHAKDLDAVIAALDKQAEETGMVNPVVRKALGLVLLQRREFAKAIVQLRLACELEPNDKETWQALIGCYDGKGDRAGAIEAIIQSFQLNRRNIELYRDLGRRFAEAKDPDQAALAERAYTSIVEVLPAETESHTMLAEIRQQQDRWPEAVEQWQQVARLRALEPTGLLKLAEAQLHLKRLDDAAATIRQLRSKPWPSRFSDVYSQIDRLEQRLRAGRGGD
jgi:tetratricopeptide (TPR) repeat protein